jgi:hypothetical protein
VQGPGAPCWDNGRLIPCLLLLLPAIAAAESPWRLGVAMGYGERSNPLLNSDDLPIILDLDIAYFGEHFFFDNWREYAATGCFSAVPIPASST